MHAGTKTHKTAGQIWSTATGPAWHNHAHTHANKRHLIQMGRALPRSPCPPLPATRPQQQRCGCCSYILQQPDAILHLLLHQEKSIVLLSTRMGSRSNTHPQADSCETGHL
jgi:hypothetical protein